MQYEFVSRALAYASCLSTLSLLMTSMAIAAVNVGHSSPLRTANTPIPIVGVVVSDGGQYGNLSSRSAIDTLAARLWSAKT
ncbi:hypothetical protein DLM45_15915 [Hyphomicrobium methylovorum]|nr:hypothetical protein [Hyphomicrobium methylovorum]